MGLIPFPLNCERRTAYAHIPEISCQRRIAVDIPAVVFLNIPEIFARVDKDENVGLHARERAWEGL